MHQFSFPFLASVPYLSDSSLAFLTIYIFVKLLPDGLWGTYHIFRLFNLVTFIDIHVLQFLLGLELCPFCLVVRLKSSLISDILCADCWANILLGHPVSWGFIPSDTLGAGMTSSSGTVYSRRFCCQMICGGCHVSSKLSLAFYWDDAFVIFFLILLNYP